MVLASLAASTAGGALQGIGAAQRNRAMGGVLDGMAQATRQRNQANQANISHTGEALGDFAGQNQQGLSNFMGGMQQVQGMRPQLQAQSGQALTDARNQVLNSVPQTPNFQGGGAGGTVQGQTQHRLSNLMQPGQDLQQERLARSMSMPLEAQNFSNYQDLVTTLSARAGSLSRDDQLRAAQIAGQFGVDMAQLQNDMLSAQNQGGALSSLGQLVSGVGAGIGGLGVSPAEGGGLSALGGQAPYATGGQIPLMSAQNVPIQQYQIPSLQGPLPYTPRPVANG